MSEIKDWSRIGRERFLSERLRLLITRAAELKDDRSIASLENTILKIRRELDEIRDQKAAEAARKGQSLSPAERLERFTAECQTLDDAFLEAAVIAYCERRGYELVPAPVTLREIK